MHGLSLRQHFLLIRQSPGPRGPSMLHSRLKTPATRSHGSAGTPLTRRWALTAATRTSRRRAASRPQTMLPGRSDGPSLDRGFASRSTARRSPLCIPASIRDERADRSARRAHFATRRAARRPAHTTLSAADRYDGTRCTPFDQFGSGAGSAQPGKQRDGSRLEVEICQPWLAPAKRSAFDMARSSCSHDVASS